MLTQRPPEVYLATLDLFSKPQFSRLLPIWIFSKQYKVYRPKRPQSPPNLLIPQFFPCLTKSISIHPVVQAINLGISLVSSLSPSPILNPVTSTSWIFTFLPEFTYATSVQAVIHPHLDPFSNTSFHGCPFKIHFPCSKQSDLWPGELDNVTPWVII